MCPKIKKVRHKKITKGLWNKASVLADREGISTRKALFFLMGKNLNG